MAESEIDREQPPGLQNITSTAADMQRLASQEHLEARTMAKSDTDHNNSRRVFSASHPLQPPDVQGLASQEHFESHPVKESRFGHEHSARIRASHPLQPPGCAEIGFARAL